MTTSWRANPPSAWTWRAARRHVLNRDGWVCHYCGAHVHPRCNPRYCPSCATVDHVTARAAGGTDDPTNLVASCRQCNLDRGDAGSPDPTTHPPASAGNAHQPITMGLLSRPPHLR